MCVCSSIWSCPWSVLGCYPVLHSLCILPPVHRFACATAMCIGCSSLKCRLIAQQVSLLWEVLQWDPGQQCDPGRWPGAVADVSDKARVAEHYPVVEIVRLLSLSGCHYVDRNEVSVTELNVFVYLLLFAAAWSQKSSLRRRKMTCWTLNREYCLGLSFNGTSFDDRDDSLIIFRTCTWKPCLLLQVYWM